MDRLYNRKTDFGLKSFEAVFHFEVEIVNPEYRKWCQEYDRVAEAYDRHAFIHQKMGYRLLLLPPLQKRNWQHILEIGCRTGYLAQLLLEKYPQSLLTTCHFSARMAAIAYSFLGHTPRVEQRCGLMSLEHQREMYDLLIANAVFHRWTHPREILAKCYQLLQPGGCLVASVFGPQTLHELRTMFHQTEDELGIKASDHILSFFQREFWEELLQSLGYVQIQMCEYWWRQEAVSCQQILRTMKGMGESALLNRQSFGTSYRLLRRLFQRYDRAYRFREGVYTTIHVIQFVAHK